MFLFINIIEYEKITLSHQMSSREAAKCQIEKSYGSTDIGVNEEKTIIPPYYFHPQKLTGHQIESQLHALSSHKTPCHQMKVAKQDVCSGWPEETLEPAQWVASSNSQPIRCNQHLNAYKQHC
jgi:hypothetical protein